MAARIFYVGTDAEVFHHAQPLRDQFDVQIANPEEVVSLATDDDLAIFFSEHFRRFRSAVMHLKQKRCRTLYAIDGILEWRNAFENRDSEPACPWTMRPVLSDKVAVIGRSQARMLDFWGNKDKVELVGLPRLDDLTPGKYESPEEVIAATNQPLENTCNPAVPFSADTEVKPKDTPVKRLLVMTAKWPAYTEYQQAKMEESLECVKTWGEQHPEVEITWRLTRDLDKTLNLENSFTSCSQHELANLLQQCDALITTPSTAMLEGMLLRKPTAILEFNDCPQLNFVAWQIRHPDQLGPVIAELLSPSAFKLAQQEFALCDTLECESPASPRLTTLVQRMLEFPAGEAPANLVPINSSPRLSSLGSAFLYNQYRLAESNDTDAIKAQLAFMQREYDILKARNTLIEREFERAKSTIDNVFNNPVVSPFIKAGEWAGKIFSKSSPSTNE